MSIGQQYSKYLTLGAHVLRGLQYLSCVCVCVSVLASFPGLSRFYVRLVHAKHECKEKFEKRE